MAARRSVARWLAAAKAADLGSARCTCMTDRRRELAATRGSALPGGAADAILQ